VGERSITLLHIFPSFARGGQQMRLAALAGALESRLRHHVVSLDGDLSARDAFADIEVTPLSARKSGGVSVSNLRKFRSLFARVAPDVLCTYNFGALEAALANALGRRRPHVHYEDGFSVDEAAGRQKWRRVLMRRLVLRSSFVVVPSRTLESIALRSWKLPRENVRRIANGIDAAKFAFTSRPSKKGRATVIGSVGALRAEKNFARLVRIVRSLPPSVNASLIIVGDGPERPRLQEASAADPRVRLVGATRTPEAFYRDFDIFALSSDTEQMPLSLMEAMAAGLPVVATDVGDVREMLAPENRELVASLGDDAEFSTALRRLVEDASLREKLGAANAEKARNEFSLPAMIASHHALYVEALQRGRP
jgi:glycosyltransferase involved in cell wall biosynthesis